jgi:hypothetical protein
MPTMTSFWYFLRNLDSLFIKKGDISVALCSEAPLIDKRCSYFCLFEGIMARKLKG